MNTFAARLAVVVGFLLVLAVVCWPAFDMSRNFTSGPNGLWAYPQDAWLASTVLAGEWPVWNRFQSCGSSPLANPAVGLFYPLKAVLLIAPFERSFKVFVGLHLLLALLLSYGLARRLGAGRAPGALAAVGYAMGGAALFGAAYNAAGPTVAWLPLVFWAADRAAHHGRASDGVWLGLAVVLIYTGGDVQMACLAGLGAALYLLVVWPTAARGVSVPGYVARMVSMLAVALLVVLTVGAIQILPAWDLMQRGAEASGLAALGYADGPMHPWRLVEFVWPNALGRSLPIHQHWGQALVGEPGWAPSLYMGSLVAVMAVAGALRFWRPRTLALLVVGAGACVVAADGRVLGALPLYLPGQFMPVLQSKSLLLASLAAAMLGARGCQRFLERLGEQEATGRPGAGGVATVVAVVFALASIALAVVVFTQGEGALAWVGADLEQVDDTALGAFQESTVAATLRMAAIQGAVVGAVLVLLVLMSRRGLAPRALLAVVLWIVGAWDVVLANRWLAAVGPGDLSMPEMATDGEPRTPVTEHRLLQSRLALPEDVDIGLGRDPMEERVYRGLACVAGNWNLLDAAKPWVCWRVPGAPLPRHGLAPDSFGASADLHEADRFYCRVGRAAQPPEHVGVTGFPRAWLVPQARYYETTDALRQDLMGATTRPAEPKGLRPLDLAGEVCLQQVLPEWGKHGSARLKFGKPEVAIEDAGPGARVITLTQVEADGYVVVSERFAPGWSAEATAGGADAGADAGAAPESRPVLRANGILMAVPFKKTDRTITLRYANKWFTWGMWISGVSVLNVLLLLVLSALRPRPAPIDEAPEPTRLADEPVPPSRRPSAASQAEPVALAESTDATVETPAQDSSPAESDFDLPDLPPDDDDSDAIVPDFIPLDDEDDALDKDDKPAKDE